MIRTCRSPCSTEFLLGFLIAVLCLTACSQKRVSKDESLRHHYIDVSQTYLPNIPGAVKQASFAWLTKDKYKDVILLNGDAQGRTRIFVLINQGKKKFGYKKNAELDEVSSKGVHGFWIGDIDADGTEDLVLLTPPGESGSARVMFNNGTGMFFNKEGYRLPFIMEGMEQVRLIDIDQDHDLDLIFFGRDVKKPDKSTDPYSVQLFLNQGNGVFEDATQLLLPKLPPGIVEMSFADYDGNQSVDIFLVYEKGQNRLLINNGLGQFADRTDRLPRILDESMSADWADFDLDGDNDLLVVNRSLSENQRDFPGEVNYFLENTGGGLFRKRSHKDLPPHPVSRVYLLDGNENGFADVILLSAKGIKLLGGRGKWAFNDESARRLPQLSLFVELAFGDFSADQSLDILALTYPERKPRLWLSSFE